MRSCYRSALAIACKERLATIAFCAISTGVFRYPPEEATRIAIEEVRLALDTAEFPRKVIFTCFDSDRLALYQRLLDEGKAP